MVQGQSLSGSCADGASTSHEPRPSSNAMAPRLNMPIDYLAHPPGFLAGLAAGEYGPGVEPQPPLQPAGVAVPSSLAIVDPQLVLGRARA